MASTTAINNFESSGQEIRQRIPENPEKPLYAGSPEAARAAVLDLNAAEDATGKDEKEKRTFGRTPDGKVFTVPQTHDMVSQLFDPREPKNVSDFIVIVLLAFYCFLLYILPTILKQPVFAVTFLFWRACYNGGIGILLKEQSENKTMVEWAKRWKVFENPKTGKNPHPALYQILKREMETKIPKDYSFEEAPIEYNTWLAFRRVVDVVLMCDFTCYCLFAVSCGGTPEGEHFAMTVGRWLVGITLVIFNLWVKLDAHRVVKDYAWYWGDFFFLIDQELTFDGVFEMAPHPMYSVGYAGYYGISLMAASYKVLFISIVAHAAQFAFLALVESPHIEKTYNPPPPRKRTLDVTSLETSMENQEDSDDDSPMLEPISQRPPPMRDLIGISNLDFHRVADVSAFLIQFYLYTMAFLTPHTRSYQTLFVVNAVIWRLWYSLGIGYILDRQSKKKKWTRHFIKWGETTEEAWRQWKGVYHISMIMCYVSFVVAAYKMYTLPPDWEYGMVLLRHVIGLAMISLQLWTVVSIYDSLGEFGWFFGDFFFRDGAKLTYSGIYRFLNNPERVIGLAGLWGLAIITWSKTIFFLALLSHVLTLLFLQFVERPHMQKRYGQSLRQHSGLSRSLKKSLPKQFQQWHGNLDRMLEETAEYVEELLENTGPKFAANLESLVKDTRALLQQYPKNVNLTRVAPSLSGFDRDDYSLKFEGTISSDSAALDKASGREGEFAQETSIQGQQFHPVMLEYGAPIRVRWTAPLHHSKKDWIGLYMLADNRSKEVTRTSTHGRWIATSKGSFDLIRAEQGILVSDKQTIHWEGDKGQPLMTGELEFTGDKLWWTTGVFEFRYHHDGKHNVMAISEPFETRISTFDPETFPMDQSMKLNIEKVLLPVVRNCFDRDPEIAPNDAEEAFGGLVERDGKFAQRVVYAVRQMFGIEFAAEVVKADGNVRNLAWRICNAKQVLAPYSMSLRSGGERSPTPTEENKL